MDKKNKRKKRRIIVLASILAIVLIGVAAIFLMNSTYHYDPALSSRSLAEGETGVLTLQYNGADGKPESETIRYSKLEALTLPEVSKQGYHFSGWTIENLFVGNEVTLNAKKATAKAQFDKDYSAVNSACAIYTDDASFTEYAAGAYESINKKAVDVYLDGGYKLTVYSKENFAGKETKVYYSGMFSGSIGSMKIEAVNSEAIEISTLSNEEKVMLLTTFAPRIWWDENEQFFASSTEFATQNMDKILMPYGYGYYLKEMDSPKFMSAFLYGDQAHAKACAFATEKEWKYLDLSYFFFAPYNKGKVIAGMEFGNHVGDWEHVTVRLLKEERGGTLTYRPIIVEYSAHFFRNYYAWDEVEKAEGTHPVAYTACGSHGMWKDSGTHVYVNAVVVKLKDYCSQGTAWDLWKNGNMETYAYDALAHKGEGIGESRWNHDFDLDYGDVYGGVTIWGNTGWCPPVQVYPRMDSAPSGPQHKKTLDDYYTMSDKKNES